MIVYESEKILVESPTEHDQRYSITVSGNIVYLNAQELFELCDNIADFLIKYS